MSRSWGPARWVRAVAAFVCVVAALVILPSTVAAADGAKTLTVTLGSDAAVVVAASDASGVPVNGLSLTMLARSDTGSIVGPRTLAADAGQPGRYATGPSALPAGTWSVTVSEGGGARTTVVLTSSGSAAEAKPNPRHPQPTRTTAGKLVGGPSRTGTVLGIAAVALVVGVAAAVILATRPRRAAARRPRAGARRR
jgi:hypothetical protein